MRTYTYSNYEKKHFAGYKPNPAWKWWKPWLDKFVWSEYDYWDRLVFEYEAKDDKEARLKGEIFVEMYGRFKLLKMPQAERGSMPTSYIPTSSTGPVVEKGRTNLLPKSEIGG